MRAVRQRLFSAAFGLLALVAMPSTPLAADGVTITFAPGSAEIAAEEAAKLDLAVRAFREGNWLRFVVSGQTDTIGPPDVNLALSVERALAVAHGLRDRGIAADQLQIMAVGETELVIETPDQTAEAGNRVVQITMR